MSIVVDHVHRGMLPTGYRNRDIKVEKGVSVVRVPEPVYADQTVFIPCPYCYNAGVDDGRAEAATEQDALDGAALRWLREALPERSQVVIHKRPTRSAREYPIAMSGTHWDGVVYGATIAEAADKCREALA